MDFIEFLIGTTLIIARRKTWRKSELNIKSYSGLSLVIYHPVLCLRLVIFGSDRSSRNHSVCQYPRSPERGHLAAGVITHDTSRSFVTCLRLVIFGSDRRSRNHSVCQYPGSPEHGHQTTGVITHDTSWFLIGLISWAQIGYFLAPTGAQGITLCGCLWGTN